MTTSLSYFAKYKNINISKTKKDGPKNAIFMHLEKPFK